MLQTFRNSLLSPDSLHPLGNGTIRCILLLVNSILRLSYETGQTNGILYLPPRLPKKRPEVPVFTLQEQEQLEHYLTAHTGISEAVIYLGLYTGLRVGELCALRWENIHFSDRYLHVRHTVQRLTRLDTTHKSELILSGPKSISSNRLVPLPAFLLADPTAIFSSGTPGLFSAFTICQLPDGSANLPESLPAHSITSRTALSEFSCNPAHVCHPLYHKWHGSQNAQRNSGITPI